MSPWTFSSPSSRISVRVTGFVEHVLERDLAIRGDQAEVEAERLGDRLATHPGRPPSGPSTRASAFQEEAGSRSFQSCHGAGSSFRVGQAAGVGAGAASASSSLDEAIAENCPRHRTRARDPSGPSPRSDAAPAPRRDRAGWNARRWHRRCGPRSRSRCSAPRWWSPGDRRTRAPSGGPGATAHRPDPA